jgi:hypothetical protein
MPLNINGNIISSNITNSGGVIQNYPTAVQNGIVLWLDAGRSQSFYDVNYYDCGYGCQYYASNPGCTNCNIQWNDISPSYCRGQFLNSPTFSFNNGGAVVFDGINDYVQINNFNNKPSAQITCEAWIKPTRASVGTGTIRGGVISATSNMYFGIIDSIDGGSTMSLHWANNTNNGSQRPGSVAGSIPNNAWSYIAGTYDGSTSRAYINGVEVWSAAQTGTVPDSTYVVGTYGAGLTDGVHNFNGHIAIARIYNRGLSGAEVLQNYNVDRGRFGL